MQPAAEGTGVIAGGAMRAVFEVVGVTNVLAKCAARPTRTTSCAPTLERPQNCNNPGDRGEARQDRRRDGGS